MKRQVLRIVGIAAITAGGVLPFATPAQADTAGVLSGNQVNVVIQTPINTSGNAVAIGGFAWAGQNGTGDSMAAKFGKWSQVVRASSRTWS